MLLAERPTVTAEDVAPPIVALPEPLGYRIKNRLLGPPLHTERLEHETLGKPTALAVFASDNLSSSAYATEEILRVLLPWMGFAAFTLVTPITIALLVVLGFLILSYRQTIKAYPSAGGAYIVTRDNFGLLPAQVAGVALLTDYVLTVAVSVAAGSDALASGIPPLAPYKHWIAIGFVCVIAYGNLRGTRESGRLFAAPTYLFIVNMGLLLGIGAYRLFTRRPAERRHQCTGDDPARSPSQHRLPDGSVGLRGSQGLRLGWRGRDWRRGHLERRPGLSTTGMEERPPHLGHHGIVARQSCSSDCRSSPRTSTQCPTTTVCRR